jgi:hypothetical protein
MCVREISKRLSAVGSMWKVSIAMCDDVIIEVAGVFLASAPAVRAYGGVFRLVLDWTGVRGRCEMCPDGSTQGAILCLTWGLTCG